MLSFFIILLSSFTLMSSPSLYDYEAMQEKLDCLFGGGDDEELCKVKEEPLPSNQKRLQEIMSTQIGRDTNQSSGLDIRLGNLFQDYFDHQSYLSFGYFFQDDPWGFWRLEAGYRGSEGVKAKSFGMILSQNIFSRGKWGLSLGLGSWLSLENYHIEKVIMERRIVLFALESDWSYHLSDKVRLFFGVRLYSPWAIPLYEKYAENLSESLAQRQLSQYVNDSTESVRISAHLGLNYLFD